MTILHAADGIFTEPAALQQKWRMMPGQYAATTIRHYQF